MTDDTAREEMLKLLTAGLTRSEAAAAAGIELEVVRLAHIASPDFEQAMTKAEAAASANAIQALWEAAKSGNVQAAKASLKIKGKKV